jgi:heat shock protein HslJ
MKTIGSACALAALAALIALGCGKKPDTQESRSGAADTTSAPAGVVTAPTLLELKTGTYTGIEGLPASVTLVNGRWEGAPYVEGAAARPALQFVRDFRLVGDLDQDGDEDAAVLVSLTTGGSGELIYLAVVLREDSTMRHAASALLGDRVQIRAARIDGNRIVMSLVRAGKSDAMCCPGELAERAWTYANGGLQEDPVTARPGRLSLAALEGVEWVLRSWTSYDNVRPDEPEVTARIEGDRISGSTGCNRYFGRLAPGKQPGDVSITPLGGTRMACQDPAYSTEARFTRQLRGLRKYGFVTGQLALSYEEGGYVEVMLFDARPIEDKDAEGHEGHEHE